MSRAYRFHGYEADCRRRRLTLNGEVVPLAPRAFDVLEALLERAGRTVTRDELRTRVWSDRPVVEANMTQAIYALRKAFEETPGDQTFVVTVPREGYRFVAEVEEAASSPVPPSSGRTSQGALGRWRGFPRMTAAIALGALAMLVAVAILRWPSPSSPNQTLDDGFGQTAEAASPARLDASALIAQGRLLLSGRSSDGVRSAIALFHRALDQDPSRVDACLGLADSYVILASYRIGGIEPPRAFEWAKSWAERALELEPGSGRAHSVLAGIAWNFSFDRATAEQHFEQALARDPRDSRAHHWLALMLMANGEIEQAKAHLRRAMAQDPISLQTPALHQMAALHNLLGEHEEAQRAIEHALLLDPGSGWTQLVAGQILLEEGRFEEALDHLERAHQLLPEPPMISAALGVARARVGDTAGAERVLESLAREARANRPFAPEVAVLSAALGHRTEAEQWIDRAVERHELTPDVVLLGFRSQVLADAGLLERIAPRLGLATPGATRSPSAV